MKANVRRSAFLVVGAESRALSARFLSIVLVAGIITHQLFLTDLGNVVIPFATFTFVILAFTLDSRQLFSVASFSSALLGLQNGGSGVKGEPKRRIGGESESFRLCLTSAMSRSAKRK